MKSFTPSGVAAEQRASRPTQEARPLKLGHMSPALVVEDNYLAALDLSRLLDDMGIESRITPRIAVARNLAREVRPKLAVLDINLEGGFEGVDLARELQAHYGTKIIFVTGYHVRDLMHRLNGADNMAVVFKPVDPDVLATVIEKISATLAGAN